MAFGRPRRQSEPRALEPEPYDPAWSVPPHFNFAHDVVDVLARDRFCPALTHVAGDGTVDRCTFADIARESTRWARLLHERVPEPGARVVIALEPGTAWAAAIVGALRIGVLPVPVGSALSTTDLALRIVEVDPALVLVDLRSAAAMEGATRRLREGPPVLTLEEASWELLRVGEPTRRADVPVDEPAVILYTAGRSSGRPRPVVHSHAATYAAYVPAQEWLDAGPGDLVWCTADGGSSTALWTGLLGPWSTGAAVLHIDGGLEPGERAELLARFPPTIAVQSPAGHAALLDLLDETGLRLDGLRNAVSAGASLDRSLVDRFRSRTGIHLLNGFETTETGTVVFQPFGATAPAGAIGLPAPGHIVAPIDEEGYVVPVGVIGDLAVYGRPPSLCSGYWSGSAPADRQGGDWWTITGDRASFDQAGQLRLDERRPAELDTPGDAAVATKTPGAPAEGALAVPTQGTDTAVTA